MKLIKSDILTAALKILIAINVVIIVLQLSSFLFFRLDLTEEKRFSIGDATKSMLANLEDNVYIEVYLEGDLPAGFKRMRSALAETLEEFKVYSGNNVQYQFSNPDAALSQKSRNKFLQDISNKGIQPTDVSFTENGNKVQKRIIPGVVISYGNQEVGVQLLKGNKTASSEQRLNQSIEGIEYEIAKAIQSVTSFEKPIIGIITGHHELDSADLYSLAGDLRNNYRLKKTTLTKQSLSGTDIIMMAQPKSPLSENERYNLDQYIVKGGKALLLLDKLNVNMDSANVGTYTFPYELNMDDLLFKYGVRINNDLVQDFVSNTIPIIVGNSGNQPQVQKLQWPFHPVINDFGNHLTVRNLDAVIARFTSSIDTVKAVGIKKTPLLYSSDYSRRSQAPVRVDINNLKKTISPDNFIDKRLPLGYLLEGRFTSFYKNKFIPESASQNNFVSMGSPGKIIVFGDGDLARNELDLKSGAPLPLGFDPFNNYTFANNELLQNCIQYLIAGDGLITARGKQIKIRPLNKVKTSGNRVKWQIINLCLPLVIIILFGILWVAYKKQKFAKF